MDSKKSDSVKSPSKQGYEIIAPPKYEEAVNEPGVLPEYEEGLQQQQDEDLEDQSEERGDFETGLFECFGSPMTGKFLSFHVFGGLDTPKFINASGFEMHVLTFYIIQHWDLFFADHACLVPLPDYSSKPL